jgi:hypothetical protein
MIDVHLMRTKLSFLLIAAALLVAGLTSVAMATGRQPSTPVCYGTCPTLTQFTLSARTLLYRHERVEVFHVTVRRVDTDVPELPTGTVAVRQAVGTLTLCTITLVRAQGSCSPAPRLLPSRSYPYWLHATYTGDAKFGVSTSWPPQALRIMGK